MEVSSSQFVMVEVVICGSCLLVEAFFLEISLVLVVVNLVEVALVEVAWVGADFMAKVLGL